MKILIVIPTYKRIEKLKRCLNSISNQTYKNFSVVVGFDNNDIESYEHFKKLNYDINVFTPICFNKQMYVIGIWNFSHRVLLEKHNADAIAWLVDDVELYPNYLRELAKCMQDNFPDTDGVIGVKQECPGRPDYTFKWYGQVLIGKRFIERYKDVDYQVCCPFYSHFHQDHELWEYAKSMNKFIKCETAVLKHYHPAFLPNEVDATHPLVRGEVKRKDDAIFRDRQSRGLIWGKSWEE